MRIVASLIRSPVLLLVRLLTGVYFRRIEIFRADRVPAGPVLFVANHPGSLTDAMIVALAVPRPVHFLATAQLFRFAPLAWFLRQCGIIPLNRREDDPAAMRSVAGSFEAAYRVLEPGGAVAIFPEGVTYDDARLRELKSGAARLALELEHRHGGRLGLRIVPVGITYSAKDRYRSEVLVYFGEPVAAANFLPQYAERRKECIAGLTARLARRLQSVLVHLPAADRTHLVAAVQRLYLPELRVGSSVVTEPVSAVAHDVLLTQAIVEAVDFAAREMPERVERFTAQLHRYERLLRQMRLPESAVEELASHRHATWRVFGLGAAAVLLFPFAAVGWLLWRPPTLLVEAVSARVVDPAKRKAQAAHARMLAGLFLLTACGCAYAALVFVWLPPAVAPGVALALPVCGLVAHYYRRGLGRFAAALRTAVVLVRAPLARRHVLHLRARLRHEIESVRRAYRTARAAAPASAAADE